MMSLFLSSRQLYENYRNSSCEGLSIVFLAQWMLGDATNLIGCLLTHQLPFQIAVAVYFCGIDMCILAQYFCKFLLISSREEQFQLILLLFSDYWRRDSRLALQTGRSTRPRAYSRYSSIRAPNMRSSSTQASLSQADHDANTSPSNSIYRGSSRPGRTTLYYNSYSHDSISNYKALSETARSVANLANEFAIKAAKRGASKQYKWSRQQDKTRARQANQDALSNEDEPPSNMMDSILSDSSRNSDGFGYGFGIASTTLEPLLKERSLVAPLSSPTTDVRGRDMTRTAGKLLALNSSRSPRDGPSTTVEATNNQATTGQQPSVTSSPFLDHVLDTEDISRRPKSASRRTGSSRSLRSQTTSRGAGIVLLGVTALFGLTSRTSPRPIRTVVTNHSEDRALTTAPLTWDSVIPHGNILDPSQSAIYLHYSPRPLQLNHLHEIPPPPSWERIIGRISAWICTVLYMTSRLPQIWSNLTRKSVQGLSILLFISAALGNALYSISILVNPIASGPTQYGYISESLPFLLGSGGTLIFDAIIVMQWMAWRGLPPLIEQPHSSRHATHFDYRSSSLAGRNTVHSRRWSSMERQPLLD